MHASASTFLVSTAMAVALAFTGTTRAAESTGSYASSLASVYGGYIRIAALKDACDAAVPPSRDATAKAYAAWEAQHRGLVQDVQKRVQAMIRASSSNNDEYVRNIGKYEGEILLRRKEYRDDMIGLEKNELIQQCERLPGALKGPGMDLAKVYAAELKVIRARKSP